MNTKAKRHGSLIGSLLIAVIVVAGFVSLQGCAVVVNVSPVHAEVALAKDSANKRVELLQVTEELPQ